MLKPLVAGATALALTTGFALAQDEQSTTREKTTVERSDGSRAVDAQKTERSTDAFGSETTAQKSYSKKEGANGSQESRSRQEKTESPDGSSSSRETTTTKSSD